MRRAILLLGVPPGLVLGGAAQGSVALFSLGLGLLGLVVGARVLVVAAARHLRPERTLGVREVVEGLPLPLRLSWRLPRGLPVHVEVATPEGWRRMPPAGGEASCVIRRPGPHVVGATALRVRDDLGLWASVVPVGAPEPVLVLPAPAPTPVLDDHAAPHRVGEPEPDGLRPYVPGSPMSRIAWRASARIGELHERAAEPGRDRLPLVVVDAAGSDDLAAVAWATRTATGEVQRLLRAGGCRVLLPGDDQPVTVVDPVADWPAVHRGLARLDPGAAVAERLAVGGRRIRAAAAPPDAGALLAALPPGVRRLDGACP